MTTIGKSPDERLPIQQLIDSSPKLRAMYEALREIAEDGKENMPEGYFHMEAISGAEYALKVAGLSEPLEDW